MANELENAIPQILASVLEVFRENAVTPRLVDNRYDTEARQQGSTIDITETNGMAARDVVPSAVAPTPNNDVKPKKKQLFLNQWKEVPFTMTDKDLHEIQVGLRPRILEEAGKTLANTIDLSVLRTAVGSAYQSTGTIGTTPFATSTTDFKNTARILSTGLAPKSERYMVLDEYAHANLADLDVFKRVNESGSSEALRDGMVTRAVGSGIAENQNIPTITATQSGSAPTATAVASASLAGAEVISLSNGAGALPTELPAQGALFTIAGDTQQYSIAEINDNEPLSVGATSMPVRISPPLKLPAAANAVLTFTATHTANIAFARNAIAFASRPLLDINPGGNILESISDPITGITFRLELVRQFKQTYFSLDCLWGSKVIRPEQVVRIFG